MESAFHVNMGVYQHPTENRDLLRARPRADHEPDVFSVARLGTRQLFASASCGLDKNPQGSGAKSNATTGSGPSASFLGSDMRAAYYGGSLTGSGQSLGLLEYYGTDLADLTTYFTNAEQTNNVPITLLSTDGTSTSCVDTRRAATATTPSRPWT